MKYEFFIFKHLYSYFPNKRNNLNLKTSPLSNKHRHLTMSAHQRLISFFKKLTSSMFPYPWLQCQGFWGLQPPEPCSCHSAIEFARLTGLQLNPKKTIGIINLQENLVICVRATQICKHEQ